MFNIEMLYCEFVFWANKKLDCLLDSDVGDQQMFIALLTNFQCFVAVSIDLRTRLISSP